VELHEVTTFLEDEEGKPVSRSAFRRMRKAQKHEFMVRWFLQNYEDPSHRTSYETAEGGYLWNWGGPFDTRDEIGDKFAGLASDAVIDEVVRGLEAGGISEWAPTPGHEHYYEVTSPDDGWDFEGFSDASSDSYGSRDDLASRRQVIADIEKLESVIAAHKMGGIGHNNPPPDETVDPVGTPEFSNDLSTLREEFGKDSPLIPVVKKLGITLRDAFIALVKWGGRKLDKLFDAGIVILLTQHSEDVRKILDGIIAWLTIAAQHH
jgi:hypothetical protein